MLTRGGGEHAKHVDENDLLECETKKKGSVGGERAYYVANEHLSGCISYIPIEMLAFACTLCLCPFPFTLCPARLRVLPESLSHPTIPVTISVTVLFSISIEFEIGEI